jgi:pimeloyl-ACP methyl ester carboxylesterase
MTSECRESLEPTTRDVAARGARIRFVEAGAGAPLVLVHDYLSSHLAWEDVVPRLARRFRVIVPDLPGFGESEKPPPGRYAYGFDAFSESLVDLVAALGLGRVSICGHAMGGAVALTVAANHAHVVDKLVLVNPLVYPPRSDAVSRVAGVPLLGPLLFKQLYGRALFRSRFRERASAVSVPVPLARIDQLFDLFNVPAAREAAYATMRSMLDTRPLMASVPRVTAATFIAWGRDDRASPIEHGRRLARELRGARFEVFECGYSPPEECPDAFVDSVIAFLEEGKAAKRARRARP